MRLTHTHLHTLTHFSQAKKTILVSNNNMPSLISKTNAIFPKLESGEEKQPEGMGKVSSVYKSLVGITRTNGPQTATDFKYHEDQAKKGIKTKFNEHLFSPKGKRKGGAGGSVGAEGGSPAGSAGSASRSGTGASGGSNRGSQNKGSSLLGAPGGGMPMRSNDIFSGLDNGSRKNKELREAKAEEEREKNKNQVILTAFALCNDAREILDPTRYVYRLPRMQFLEAESSCILTTTTPHTHTLHQTTVRRSGAIRRNWNS